MKWVMLVKIAIKRLLILCLTHFNKRWLNFCTAQTHVNEGGSGNTVKWQRSGTNIRLSKGKKKRDKSIKCSRGFTLGLSETACQTGIICVWLHSFPGGEENNTHPRTPRELRALRLLLLLLSHDLFQILVYLSERTRAGLKIGSICEWKFNLLGFLKFPDIATVKQGITMWPRNVKLEINSISFPALWISHGRN